MLNEIKVINDKKVISSRDVAEMIGKKHKNLMRDIRGYIEILEKNSTLSSYQEKGSTLSSTQEKGSTLDSSNFFIESSYTQLNGKESPCYLLTKQGCEMVANKLIGEKGVLFTAKYVTLFNQYEQEHKQLQSQFTIPQTFGEALQLAADQQKLIEKNQPKVDYYDEQMRNPGLMTVTEIAKDFGLSATKLNQFLERKHVQYRQGKHWVLYQEYAGQALANYEPFAYEKHTIDGTQKRVHNNLKWTQKGRKFIYDLLKEEGIQPTILGIED